MLTARDTVPDRIQGLDAGADDYIVKPFDLDELAARFALLRRTQSKRATVLTFQILWTPIPGRQAARDVSLP